MPASPGGNGFKPNVVTTMTQHRVEDREDDTRVAVSVMGRQSGHGESHRLGDKNELYRCYELIISIVMMKWRVLGLGERCAGQEHLQRETGFWPNIDCGCVLLP